MSDKYDKDGEVRPWASQFGEDENINNRQFSRTERNHKKPMSPSLVKILLLVFLAVVIIPSVLIVWLYQSGKQDVVPKTAESVMITKASISSSSESSSSSQTSSASSSAAVASSTTPANGTTTNQPNTNQNGSVNGNQNTNNQAGQNGTTSNPTTNTQVSGTYTVQYGDTLYRIALDHGMTLDELKSVNGLTSDYVPVGTPLKVK